MGKNAILVFKERMELLGIDVELSANYPWIYIDKIDDQYVTEKFYSDYQFTLSIGEKFTDISEIFKILRKYSKKFQRNEKLETINK